MTFTKFVIAVLWLLGLAAVIYLQAVEAIPFVLALCCGFMLGALVGLIWPGSNDFLVR